MIGVKSIYYEKNNQELIITINEESKIKYNDIIKSVDNKILFKYLSTLYGIIDNWQNEYIDYQFIDGDNWKLIITYTNGNRKEYFGKSSYPSNFEAFESLNQSLISEV